MTAKQQIQHWKEQHRNIDSDAERDVFFEKIKNDLLSGDEKNLTEGLEALKASVGDFQREVEGKVNQKSPIKLEVFPASSEDVEMLRSILARMNIPFKLSA